MRWMRVVEGGDRRRRREKKERCRRRRKRGWRKCRERKEGVRVRVGLGVGGAIRNYCGTIDKRRLRGRTTEDSLRLSDFPSTIASLFLLAPLDFRSCVMPYYPYYSCFAHETFQTRQYVMFKNPHTTPSSGRSTWNRRFYPTLYISVDASSKPRWTARGRPCKYMILHDS